MQSRLQGIRTVAVLASLLAVAGSGSVACGPEASGSGKDGGESNPRTLSVKVENGVVFETQETIQGLKFNQVDMMFSANGGDGPRAATGGSKSTENAPANWFKGGGGMYKTYAGLDDVPRDQKPLDGDSGVCLNVKTGYGFVVKNFVSPGYTAGWVQAASPSELTIEYVLID